LIKLPEINGLDVAHLEVNGAPEAVTNGAVSMTTLPQPGHSWQITLKDKVIGSKKLPLPSPR
jgi:hypothetical protein